MMKNEDDWMAGQLPLQSEALVLSRVRAGFYHQLCWPVKAAGREERREEE